MNCLLPGGQLAKNLFPFWGGDIISYKSSFLVKKKKMGISTLIKWKYQWYKENPRDQDPMTWHIQGLQYTR